MEEIGMPLKAPSTISSAPQKFGTILSTLLAPFAKRFIAGTTLSDALDLVARLKSQGFSTTLDHLGESVSSVAEAKYAAEQYVVMLHALSERRLDTNISLKLTQMGLNIDKNLCLENLNKIVSATESAKGFMRVDMEGSDVTESTLEMVFKIKKTRNTPVGAVLQAMLKRTPQDLMRLLDKGITVRLCKGAYKEPPVIAHQDMAEIRHQYASLAKRLITSGLYHGIATHDELLINEIKNFVKEQKIPKTQFEFQMLLGIRSKLQKKLIAEGFKVRIYVPFGKAWLPYTWRRIRERKENLWFIVSHFFRS